MNFMNVSPDKYGIGQPVARSEDPLLLKGEGIFTDDISRPGQLYAHIIRSTIAHGNIISIDSNIINETLIEELYNLNKFDAHNNLIFTCNKFANDNEIDIYNICIGKPSSKTNFNLKKIFENLI